MDNAQEMKEAERPWLEAKKIIHTMQKKLGQMDKDDSTNKKLADLHAVELLLATLRLASMATTFADFTQAHENRVLEKLWQAHSMVNAEYKKALQRHRGHGQIVQLRNIEKQYVKHLKTAQYFYKGFIERLSSRYRLVPLQRISGLMKCDVMKMNEVIDAEQANLTHQVTQACYRTILHLGDLSRYRMNVSTSRQKSRMLDVALTYYGLAQDLLPQEGDAHHQMAVVTADQHKEFDVVYHFFRSWSVLHPNHLAPQNLTSEFKKLLQPAAPRRQGAPAPDPYDTFGTWLIRLHAHYFNGEEFSQQTELEREVLHRWEVLLKSAEQPEYLHKAGLMTIAAYDVSLRKIKNNWSASGSRSCQFVLLFAVRTILVLSRVLEAETDRLFDGPGARPDSQGNAPSRSTKGNGKAKASTSSTPNNAQGKKNASTDTCMSLFRVYMAWISIQRDDLVRFQEFLNPHIADMHRSVTRCLSRFSSIIAQAQAAPAPYLLPEDTEVLGLAPLDSWVALRRSDGTFKPRLDEEGVQRLEPSMETLARIHDIVQCAVELVNHRPFPWVTRTVDESSQAAIRICFVEDYVPPPTPATPAAPIASATPALAAPVAPAATPATATAAAATTPAVEQLIYTTYSSPADLAAQPAQLPAEMAMAAGVSAASPGQISIPAMRRESTPQTSWPMNYKDDIDSEDFLPEHSRTKISDRQVSSLDSEFESLGLESYNQFAGFPGVPNWPSAQFGQPAAVLPQPPMPSSSYGMHTSTAEDIFGQVHMQSPSMATSGVANASTTGPGTAQTFPNLPWGFFGTPTPYTPQHQAAGLDHSARSAFFPQARSPQNIPRADNYSRTLPPPLSAIGTTQQAGQLGPSSMNTWGRKESRLLPQQLQQAQAAALGIGDGQNAFYSSNFAVNSLSSLPPVQSPRGLPAALQQPLGAFASSPSGGPPRPLRNAFESGYMPQATEGGIGNIGSIGSISKPNNRETIRRNWEEAATAWGRGTPTSKDDPTHFRNSVRQTGLMDETNAYDQNALFSAFDGLSKPRR